MQQLHLVGFTTDHKGLILGTRRGGGEGGYVVTLDRAFVEQIEELLRRQAGESTDTDSGNGAAGLLRRPRIESRLTPRQVQSMLRTGRSVGEVAEEAGMSEDWIGRFAPPILAEQARVIDRASGLTYIKRKIGPSTQPLRESVTWNLAERGIVLSEQAVEDAWTAFHQGDGGWVVRVSYLAERRHQHADWTVDMRQGTVKAVNRLGNELGYVEPGRRRPAALPPPAPVSASAQRAAAAPLRPTAPPPRPARPSGRLSLLGTGSGTGSGSGVAATRPAREAPPTSSARSGSSASPPTSASSDPTKGVTERSTALPRRAPSGDPPADAAATPTEAPSQTAPQRRPRPLRPLPVGSTPPATREPSSVSRRPADATPPSASAPRRERPLRAPSRIARDEAGEPVPKTARRPLVAPRMAELRSAEARSRTPRSPPAPSDPPARAARDVNRFGPAHSPAERDVSTAERFGVGRATAAPSPAPRVDTAADGTRTAGVEAPTNSHARPSGQPDAPPRRPLRARRLVDEAEDESFADEEDRSFSPPLFDVEDSGIGYDPVTAPVPTLDVADEGFGFEGDPASAFGGGMVSPRDDVLIRAGQAGEAGNPTTSPRAAEADDRRSRRRQKRRQQGSS